MEEIIQLCSSWWYDSSFYKNTGMEFKPDRELFKDLSNNGDLFVVKGYRVEDNSIIACYVAAKSDYMFNTNYKMASEIVWSIHKDYRKGREVFNLIKAIEMGLKSSGITIYNLNLPLEEGKKGLSDYLVKKKDFFVQDISILKEIK